MIQSLKGASLAPSFIMQAGLKQKSDMSIRPISSEPPNKPKKQAQSLDRLFFGSNSFPSKLTLKSTYIMGDLHFNNHIHPEQVESGMKTNRPRVVEKLDQILSEYDQVEQSGKEPFEFTLLLNGDIFDLTESWPADISPTDEALHLPTVKRVIDEIISNNPEIMARFQQLMAKKNAKIHYVLGNHERWLSTVEAQNYLKQKLGLKPNDPQLTYSRKYYDPKLKLLVIHGDQFDPYCRPPKSGLNDAEILDTLVIKRILTRLPERLSKEGYASDMTEQVEDAIRTVEYVRPVHQAFAYLYRKLSDVEKQTKRPTEATPLLNIVMDETIHALRDAYGIKKLTSLLDNTLVQKMVVSTLTSSTGEKLLNFFTSTHVKKVSDDKNQLAKAQKLLEEEGLDKSIRILVLGHTHKILDQTISYKSQGEKKHCRVINPGSFKTTILYPNPDPVYPAGLLRIQWKKEKPDHIEVDFSLSQRRTILTS